MLGSQNKSPFPCLNFSAGPGSPVAQREEKPIKGHKQVLESHLRCRGHPFRSHGTRSTWPEWRACRERARGLVTLGADVLN